MAIEIINLLDENRSDIERSLILQKKILDSIYRFFRLDSLLIHDEDDSLTLCVSDTFRFSVYDTKTNIKYAEVRVGESYSYVNLYHTESYALATEIGQAIQQKFPNGDCNIYFCGSK